ncbi:hypothetical protein QBC41DRAFT_302082 [Cercophora samala]|uniref:Uncharacterized protein n=1 Tax=Cercophora samala TaxID=330535 RepID=A0AA39ZG47_9PEZI|nr:hypothetical protein QBC41DRAFT_302082 [Cercophora samala]
MACGYNEEDMTDSCVLSSFKTGKPAKITDKHIHLATERLGAIYEFISQVLVRINLGPNSSEFVKKITAAYLITQIHDTFDEIARETKVMPKLWLIMKHALGLEHMYLESLDLVEKMISFSSCFRGIFESLEWVIEVKCDQGCDQGVTKEQQETLKSLQELHFSSYFSEKPYLHLLKRISQARRAHEPSSTATALASAPIETIRSKPKNLSTMQPESRRQIEDQAENTIRKAGELLSSVISTVDTLHKFNEELDKILDYYENIPERMNGQAIPDPVLRRVVIAFSSQTLRSWRTTLNGNFQTFLVRKLQADMPSLETNTEEMEKAVSEALEASELVNFGQISLLRWRGWRSFILEKGVEIRQRAEEVVREWQRINGELDTAATAVDDILTRLN